MQRIGVLTGGGDCAGLNAVLRALALALQQAAPQVELVGIEQGFRGLIEGHLQPLAAETLRDQLDEGGSLLRTSNRADPFAWQGRDVSGEVLARLARERIEALVVLGGDGTLSLAERFARRGLPVLGLPKTIDNDIVGNERSFGFDSATAVVAQALLQLRSTARSHDRVLIVETMGRDSGWLALAGGLAGGADLILLPERVLGLADLTLALQRVLARQRHAVLCVAEGVAWPETGALWQTLPDGVRRLGGIAQALAAHLGTALPEVEARAVVLGHLQRAGPPTAFDRLLCTRLGVAAAQAVVERAWGQLIAVQGDRLVRLPLAAVAGQSARVPAEHEWLRAARALGALL